MRRRGLRGQELRTPAPESLPRRIAGPLLIAVLAVLFLGRVWFTGEVLLPAAYLSHFQPWQAQAPPASQDHWNALLWDSMAQYHPWRAFAHDSLARGVIPLWNPHQFCGTPFVANSQSAVFYPLNVVFYLMDPARAFAVSAALHLLLAGLFTYLFLRAVSSGRFGATFGGITFAFSAFYAAWIHLPTVINTAVWLPLALFFIARYFATRRPGYVIGLAFALGTALLAGHPQIFLYVSGLAALYFIFRAATASEALPRRAGRGLLAGAAAAVVCLLWGAVQLLPAAELLPLSHRATAASAQGYASYLRFAMPWQQLVTLLLPEFMGNPIYGTYFGRGNFAEYAGYVGLLPLALAVLGVIWRRDRDAFFFAAVAALALLAALGTPINLILFYLVPGFSSTGGPARMFLIYSAAMAFLAGMGADAAAGALKDSATARRFARHLAIAAIAIASAAGLFIIVLPRTFGVPWISLLSAPAINIAMLLVVLPAGSVAYWVASRRPTASAGRVALGLLLAATVADLFSFGMRSHLTAPPNRIYPETELTSYLTELTSYLREHAPGSRIMPLYQSWGLVKFPRAVLPPNSAMIYGLRDVQGYDSLYLARYRSVLAAVEGRDPSPAANGNMLLGAFPDVSLLPVLGVNYVLSQRALDAPGLARERAGEVNVYRVEKSMPRAYVPGKIVIAQDLAGSLGQLAQVSRGEAVIETSEKLPPSGAGGRGPARYSEIQGDSSNWVWIKVSRGPGFLVLSDAYYPGWRAWVDHQPARIYIANGAFRAVWVSDGAHDVEMRFEPCSFRLGLFATLIAAAAAMAAVGASLGGRARPRS